MIPARLLWLLLPIWIADAEASSTFRCDSALVSAEDSLMEVENKCGTPIDRAQLGYKEFRDRYGYLYQIPVEEWTYGPSHGMYHILRFEGGRLKEVDSRRGN